ncbi:unnamed protein product [Ectocarpus sp. 4 AP-2014]
MAPVGRMVGGLVVVCACLAPATDAFFTGVALPSSRAGAARGGNGALEMAKHRQNKGTKKHVKNRPRKSRLSDRNRKPTDYSIEVNTNGNFPGAPPVFELESEPEEGIDTKASVIEALASAEWDAEQAAKPAVDESKEMEVVMGGDWKVLETA